MKKFVFTILAVMIFSPLMSFGQNYSWPLDYSRSGSKIVLAGKLDKSKYSSDELKNISVHLYYSNAYQFKDGEDPAPKAQRGPIVPNPDKTNTTLTGVNLDTGEYFFHLDKNSLVGDSKYYYSQVIRVRNGAPEIKVGDFHTDKGILTQAEINSDFEKRSYRLLAPFPGLSIVYDPSLCEQLLREGKVSENNPVCNSQDPSGFNNFINYIFKLLIGFAAVLLVIKLIISGYQYAVTDVPFLKSSAKTGFFTSLFGLLLALSAYLILNTINPKLVSNSISISNIYLDTIDLPDAGDDVVDPDFAKGKRTFSTDVAVSPGTLAAVAKLKQGWEISQFVVYTNNRMLISIRKGNEVDNSNLIDIAPGKNGYARIGQARVGDNKTPVGNWKIISVRYKPGVAQFNKKGSNMGAAFWQLSPMQSGERGIGIHGNKSGRLAATKGCVRLKNSDLLALQPYVKAGIPVIVRE